MMDCLGRTWATLSGILICPGSIYPPGPCAYHVLQATLLATALIGGPILAKSHTSANGSCPDKGIGRQWQTAMQRIQGSSPIKR